MLAHKEVLSDSFSLVCKELNKKTVINLWVTDFFLTFALCGLYK